MIKSLASTIIILLNDLVKANDSLNHNQPYRFILVPYVFYLHQEVLNVLFPIYFFSSGI